MEEGYEKGQKCNRDGCAGIIKEKEQDGSCSCHLSAPCGTCEEFLEYCPVCDWDAEEERRAKLFRNRPTPAQIEQQEKEWREGETARNLFFRRLRGLEPIPALEIRREAHSNSSMKILGVFPPGTETKETLLPKVRGSFGGRWEKFGGYYFEYIAYTD